MTVNLDFLDTFKDKLPPMGWMKAMCIGAEERKSGRGLDMFDLHFEVIEEYNDDPEQYENTMGYKIDTVAVYPDVEIQGDKARATAQAYKAFSEAFGLGSGNVTVQDLIGKEVNIRVVYQTGQDGKDRPAIAFGGFKTVD